MAAIEYGSYYWCVVLNGEEANAPGGSIHLHADEIAIDPVGSLTFMSAGRRPAGSEPQHQEGKEGGKAPNKESNKVGKDEKGGKGSESGGMIYVAFAPGTWRLVYAAKLQDGSPASIEHWNATAGTPGLGEIVPPNSGAAGYSPHE
jgi:hypothetical protein